MFAMFCCLRLMGYYGCSMVEFVVTAYWWVVFCFDVLLGFVDLVLCCWLCVVVTDDVMFGLFVCLC